MAVADDAEFLAADLRADETVAGLAVPRRRVHGNEAAFQHREKAENQLCHGGGGIAGTVGDGHSRFFAGFGVDMVDAGESRGDKFQILTFPNERRRKGLIDFNDHIGVFTTADEFRLAFSPIFVDHRGNIFPEIFLADFFDMFRSNAQRLRHNNFHKKHLR